MEILYLEMRVVAKEMSTYFKTFNHIKCSKSEPLGSTYSLEISTDWHRNKSPMNSQMLSN